MDVNPAQVLRSLRSIILNILGTDTPLTFYRPFVKILLYGDLIAAVNLAIVCILSCLIDIDQAIEKKHPDVDPMSSEYDDLYFKAGKQFLWQIYPAIFLLTGLITVFIWAGLKLIPVTNPKHDPLKSLNLIRSWSKVNFGIFIYLSIFCYVIFQNPRDMDRSLVVLLVAAQAIHFFFIGIVFKYELERTYL